MQRRVGPDGNGLNDRIPSSSIITISPGSTSRIYSARTRSSAQVSDATIVASFSLPSTSGRNPCGSRAAIMQRSVSSAIE
jgi:hypothetical protein